MQSDSSEERLCESAISSGSFWIDSEEKEAEDQQNIKQLKLDEEAKQKAQYFQQFCRKLYEGHILVSKRLLPAQLLRKRQQIKQKIKEIKRQQAKLGQLITHIDWKIQQAQSGEQRESKVSAIQQKMQQEASKKQQRRQLYIETEYSEAYQKSKSDEIANIKKRLNGEKQKIEKLRKKRMEYSKLNQQIYNQRLLNRKFQEQQRLAQDSKLIEDRLSLLQSNIQRLKNALQKK